jgi:hypothetical protein
MAHQIILVQALHDDDDGPGALVVEPGEQGSVEGLVDPRAEGNVVIGPTGAVKVMVAMEPVDFRKGAEGLAALVRETIGADPFSGAVYVLQVG